MTATRRRHTLAFVGCTTLLAILPPGCSNPACTDGGLDGSPLIDAQTDGSDADRNRASLVRGDFSHVYTPTGTRYLNDHTIIYGPHDNTAQWHVYGITDTTQGTPSDEHIFLHATAPADPSVGETLLWAPHVIEYPANQYLMLYEAGPSLRRATSTDLFNWVRDPLDATDSSHVVPGGRDPMMFHDGDRWIVYTTGVDSDSRGQILATINSDPRAGSGWTTPTPVITDPDPSFGWGNLESPFVVLYAGYYYMFLTDTGTANTDYNRELVFRSLDPMNFAWNPITEIWSHAAEIVIDSGQYYITSAGWPSEVDENRGLLIAPLDWAPDPQGP